MRKLLALAALALVATLVAPAATASAKQPAVGETTTLRTYDADAFELPEGVAVDKTGRVYITFPFIGQLRRVDPDGSEHLVATLPTGGNLGPLGVALDASGNAYVAVVTSDPDTQGVYRVAADGSSARLPGTGAIAFANDLSFGDSGTLYVADSTGHVWRIPKGGAAEMWSDNFLLAGDGSAGAGFPVGANGITYRHKTVYVTNTDEGTIIAIPVLTDGSAGTPTVVAQHTALAGADGIELDVHGNFYVAVIGQSTIVRLSSDGTDIDVLADGSDGLDWASTIAFGTGNGNRTTLYAVNFSVGPFFGGSSTWGPALLAIEAGVPGLPQP